MKNQLKKHSMLAWFISVFIGMAALSGFIDSHMRTFTMNGVRFEQVGVIQNKLDGGEVYVPIYRRK